MIRPERCLGCRSCEIACAVAHSKSKNLFSALGENPAPKRRISVEYIPGTEISIPITCHHCENAPCVSVCPTKALSQDSITSIVTHNPERCVDCWTCSMVCSRFVSLYQLILVIGCWTSSMACNRGVIRQANRSRNKMRSLPGQGVACLRRGLPNACPYFYRG